MSTVHKFALNAGRGTTELLMPLSGKIVDVRTQASVVCLWVLRDSNEIRGLREFRVVFTGEEFAAAEFAYVGTAHNEANGLVYHVLERVEPSPRLPGFPK